MGQPITWKNVGATVSGSTAGETMEGGVKTVMGAFDPLNRLKKEAQTISDQNETQVGVNLNQAEQDRVNQIDSLTEYNQMREAGAFDPSAGRERVGYQFDAAGAKAAQEGQRDILRQAAGESAMVAGNLAGDTSLSGLDATEAYAADLRRQGASEDYIRTASADYDTKNALNKARYKEAKTEELESLLLNTKPLKTPGEIQTARDNAERDGFKGDLDAYQAALTKEMKGNRIEGDFQKTKREEANQEQYSAGVMTAIGNGEDPRKAIRNWSKKSNLTGKQAMQATTDTLNYVEQQKSLDGAQEGVYTQLKMESTSALNQRQVAGDTHIGTLQKKLSGITGLDDNVIRFAEEASIRDGGMVGTIMSSLTDTGMEPSDWWSPLKTSPSTVSAILNRKYQQIRSIPGINDVKASALLWQAYQDSVGDSYGFGGAKGVAAKSLDATVLSRIELYDNGEVLRNQIVTDTASLEKELTEAAIDYSGSLIEWRQKQGTGNLTSTPKVDSSSYAQQIKAGMSEFSDKPSPTLQREEAKVAEAKIEARRIAQEKLDKEKADEIEAGKKAEATSSGKMTTKADYQSHAEVTAKKYGVDSALVKAVIGTESNWDADAESDVGAKGLMQIMPDTARDLGITDTSDAIQSIEGGTRYLAQLNKKYNGDIDKILAAYNWGMGNVDRKGLKEMPKETRDYIKRVKEQMTTSEETGYRKESILDIVNQKDFNIASTGLMDFTGDEGKRAEQSIFDRLSAKDILNQNYTK